MSKFVKGFFYSLLIITLNAVSVYSCYILKKTHVLIQMFQWPTRICINDKNLKDIVKHSFGISWESETCSNIYLTDLQNCGLSAKFIHPLRKKPVFVHLSQASCMHCPEKFPHQSSQPLLVKTQMLFKSRTNPNEIITPDCPLLNPHWLARTWMIWRTENVWHLQVTSSWNGKEEKLLIKEICQEARKAANLTKTLDLKCCSRSLEV